MQFPVLPLGDVLTLSMTKVVRKWTKILCTRVENFLPLPCACLLSRFSHVQLCATLWTVAFHAPSSMKFSKQEYWSGLLCPLPGDLSDPGIEPTSLQSPALAGGLFTTSVTWEAHLFPAAAAAKSLQSCPTLCDPIDSSPPGSPIPGILQARTLEWVAISFSNAGK